jgi:Pyridoxamine 5'-phosphate oxidase
MTWAELEQAAPELARALRSRFEACRLALLGTIRADGSPRISPVEPYFTTAALLFGAMARSAKARDLDRDPRCVLHSVIAEPDAGETEFKLYGTAVGADPAERSARADAWWFSQPPETAHVYVFEVEEAVSVAWALTRGEMTVTRLSPQRGLEETTRRYP